METRCHAEGGREEQTNRGADDDDGDFALLAAAAAPEEAEKKKNGRTDGRKDGRADGQVERRRGETGEEANMPKPKSGARPLADPPARPRDRSPATMCCAPPRFPPPPSCTRAQRRRPPARRPLTCSSLSLPIRRHPPAPARTRRVPCRCGRGRAGAPLSLSPQCGSCHATVEAGRRRRRRRRRLCESTALCEFWQAGAAPPLSLSLSLS